MLDFFKVINKEVLFLRFREIFFLQKYENISLLHYSIGTHYVHYARICFQSVFRFWFKNCSFELLTL